MWLDRLRKVTGHDELDASAWFSRMRSDTRTVEDEIAFERWLAQDPAHEQEYLDLLGLWGELEGFQYSTEVVNARRAANSDSQRTANDMRVFARLAGSRRAFAGGVAFALIAIVLAFGSFGFYSDTTYKTMVGDRRTVQLSDGSEVVLNTDTLLRVAYRPWLREVTLERGQAYFKVAHAVVRPFEVQAGTSRVRALGTAFDVQMLEDSVKVTLVEGHVAVSDAAPMGVELNPGQAVSAQASGLTSVQTASLPKATAWLQGRLVFEDERLADAVAEINRYSPVRLVILDDALANVRINGVFRAGRAESFVDALKASFDIETQHTADGALVLRRGEREVPQSPDVH